MEETIVKKSIFKQTVSRKLYKYFSDSFNYKPEIREYLERVREETIFVCNLEMPILRSGEFFYILEQDKIVQIYTVMRSSDESICYIVGDRVVQDEKSEKTYSDAYRILEKYYECEKFDKLQKFKDTVEKSFWFRFIKKNI
jgi:hypothetical protein